MTVSIKEDVPPGYQCYVHPDALPSLANSMTATTTTPLVIMGVVVTCARPFAMAGANTSSANQPNSSPSKRRVGQILSRGRWMVLVCGCSLSWRLHYSSYCGGFRDFDRGLRGFDGHCGPGEYVVAIVAETAVMPLAELSPTGGPSLPTPLVRCQLQTVNGDDLKLASMFALRLWFVLARNGTCTVP
jgi:hypothetical protein